MPIDPSIITNTLAGVTSNLPDIGNIMAQRVRGAENIYKIETARQEAAKEEAAAQEQAALRALTPAVAMAFSDPSDAGLNDAFSMVPEEYAGVADEQLAQLRAIPDVNRRKAVIRSALLQDDYGRALLAQLEPTANMRLQEETAARRAALDERRMTLEEQKLALDAEGQGDWKLQEGEGGFFWVNPRTREVIPADVTAGPAAPGAPDVEAPISTAQPPREFRPKVKAGEATGDKQQARQGVDGTLSRIMDQYKILAEEKAIVSAENTGAENVQARISTKLGPTVGRTVGTKAQTARDTIANLRQALLADIKAATGMSSKAIDSNVELKSFLDSLGDPDQSLETIQNTLAELSIKYGLGTLSTGGAEAPAATTGTSGFKIRGVREQ